MTLAALLPRVVCKQGRRRLAPAPPAGIKCWRVLSRLAAQL